MAEMNCSYSKSKSRVEFIFKFTYEFMRSNSTGGQAAENKYPGKQWCLVKDYWPDFHSISRKDAADSHPYLWEHTVFKRVWEIYFYKDKVGIYQNKYT